MFNGQVYELTENGKLELEQELAHLKNVARPKNIEALKEARAQGDLSENADYDAARDDQSRIEARIVHIENILKNAKIITSDNSNNITMGKTVTVVDLSTNKTKVYSVVGTIEADPFNGKISNESPTGKALIGKKTGDVVTFYSATGKEIKLEIKNVE